LPIEERETLDSGLRQIDFLDAEIASVDRVIAHDVLNWPQARRLMTVPGVNVIVATFPAAVGNIERFPDRRKLVAYRRSLGASRSRAPGPRNRSDSPR
jgi:transposase